MLRQGTDEIIKVEIPDNATVDERSIVDDRIIKTDLPSGHSVIAGAIVEISEENPLPREVSDACSHDRTEEGEQKRLRMMSVADVFQEIAKKKEFSKDCSTGVLARGIIREMNLKFENSKTIHHWADFTDPNEEEFLEEMHATRALVDEDTKNAQSISKSGPTS